MFVQPELRKLLKDSVDDGDDMWRFFPGRGGPVEPLHHDEVGVRVPEPSEVTGIQEFDPCIRLRAQSIVSVELNPE